MLLSNGKEGVLHISQSFKAGALPSDGLLSLVGDGLTPLQKSSQCILQPQQTGLSLFAQIYIFCVMMG